MTKTILEAFEKQNNKFEEIDGLSVELSSIFNKKTCKAGEIKELYTTLFTNFFNKRMETKATIIFENKNYTNTEKLFLNKDGFSLGSTYGSNSTSILQYDPEAFINVLKAVSNLSEEDVFLKLKEGSFSEKKINFIKRFLKDVDKLDFNRKLNKQLDGEKCLYNDSRECMIHQEIVLEPDRLIVKNKYKPERWDSGEMYINLHNPKLEGKVAIEQVYDYLKPIMEEFIVIQKNKLEEVSQFFEDKKREFAKELIVKSLSKKK